jgi:ankyrin repeat protein
VFSALSSCTAAPRAGASVEARGVNAVTPLICAAGSNSPETVELLLDAGADVNICSKQGTSALMYAAMNGRPECAKLLLAKGADATLRSGLGRTALHFAASGPSGKEDVAHAGDYPAVASLLLAANGAEVDAQDADGWTPLYCAAAVGQTEMLKLLRQHGADVNKRDAGTGAMPMGATPLHQACAGRHEDCVKELVKAGADEFAQDKLKRTPRDALPDAFMGEPSFQACQWCLENAAKIDETACGQLGRLLQKDTAVDVQAGGADQCDPGGRPSALWPSRS